MDSIPIREYTRVYNKERRIFKTTILERYEIRIVFWYHEKFDWIQELLKVWFVSKTIHTHTAVEIASINTGRAFWGEILHLNFILNLAKYWRDQKSHKINHKWKNGRCWEIWCENYILRSTYYGNIERILMSSLMSAKIYELHRWSWNSFGILIGCLYTTGPNSMPCCICIVHTFWKGHKKYLTLYLVASTHKWKKAQVFIACSELRYSKGVSDLKARLDYCEDQARSREIP